MSHHAPDKGREYMHRRAQIAEAKLERATWWLEAGMKASRDAAMRDGQWPMDVPRFYLEEALKALVGDRSA